MVSSSDTHAGKHLSTLTSSSLELVISRMRVSTTGAEAMTASQRITERVTSWPGVEAGPGRRGEFAFTVGRRQIGHLHGDRVAHFGFPPAVGAELREQGRVGPHPVFPGREGPAARRIEDEAAV